MPGPRSLRDLPSIDKLLADERLADAPHELAVDSARSVLERAREEIRAGREPEPLVDSVLEELARARRPSLRRVLNATGVLVHTNLGRAPLAEAALERVREVGAGYSNLEYDLERGERGSRQDHLGSLLERLTGAEAALVVNNNAAAVLLALAALAEGREVVVSRGELIEIGDGFRIPDVLARSGARLVEVGTTNRTRAEDYERAIGPETAAAAPGSPVELPTRRVHRTAGSRSSRTDREASRPPARRRPRLGRARHGRRRADAGPEPPCRGRPRLLLGGQAPRRTAGGDRRRSGGAGRAPSPSPTSARAARRQAHPRRARGNALPRTRSRDTRSDSGAPHAPRAAREGSCSGGAARVARRR